MSMRRIILASALAVSGLQVLVNGSGNATVTASGQVDATIWGSGSVYYRGSAIVHLSTPGSGRFTWY